MVGLRMIVLFVVVCVAASDAHSQSLDLLRVGGAAQATDRGVIVFLSPSVDLQSSSVGTDVDDVSASVINSASADDGIGMAEVINNSLATVSTPTGVAAPAASVNVANMVTAETACTVNGEYIAAGQVFFIPGPDGVVADAAGAFQVQADPLNPSTTQALLECTLSVIGSGALTGVSQYQNAGTVVCGRYQIQFVDGNGASTLTILDGQNVVATYTGGAGANYMVRGRDVVAVGSQFNLIATGDTRARAESRVVGASTAMASVSTLGSVSATGITGNPPNPSLEVEFDGVVYPVPLD